jgi:diguanylate cyclase (GGDEF)-like protein
VKVGHGRETVRSDSTLGALCGLGAAAAAWTLAGSPALLEGSFWTFLAAGMLACLWQPLVPGLGRISWRTPFVVSALVIFGAGASILAYLAGSVAVAFGREKLRPSVHPLATLYDVAAGTLVTVLASLAFLAAGGVAGGSPSVMLVVPLTSFVLMHLVAERVAEAVRMQHMRFPRGAESERGWLLRGLLTATATSGALVVCVLYTWPATRPWLWVLPTIGFVSYLQSRREGGRTEPSPRLSPVTRSIARALSVALSPGREPDGTADQRRELALELGRRMGLDDSELDDLEAAAWLFEIDRLRVPPLREKDRDAEKFRRESGLDIDEDTILEALCLPASVREILMHRHERWDGAGVPEGLAGAQIPRGARILAVAGGYVSMIVGAPERPPLAPHRALAELRSEAGRIFDPRALEHLAGHLRAKLGPTTAGGSPHGTSTSECDAGEDSGDRPPLPAVQRELHALYEIGRAVSYRLDLDENLTLILDKLDALVPHASAVVYLGGGEGAGLRARFVRGIGTSTLEGLSVSVDACPSGIAFAGRRSSLGNGGRARMPYDPGEWDLDALVDSPLNAVLRTAVASPLVSGGHCLGVLTLYDRAGRRFSDEERRRLAAVAGHVARAVHNADPGNPGYLESLTDPLTGLPNGRYLEICSRDLLPSSLGSGSGFSLLAFRVRDLDRVCERGGIAAVERLLGILARRLASSCRDVEVPVRYGQDLFVVLSPASARGELIRRWDALLRAAEGRPLELQGGQTHDLRLASAHASCPEEGEDLDALLEVLGMRLGLAFDRGHTVLPFRLVRSAG